MFDIDTSRSYATEKNLITALKKFGFADCKYLVVCTRSGKFTAVFSLSLNKEFVGGNVTIFARHGFQTFG